MKLFGRDDFQALWHRWILPAVSILVFAAVAWVIRHQLEHFRFSGVLHHLRAIPASAISGAVLLTILSYWLLGFYDVLALRYVGRPVPYIKAAFTSFIAYAFGHNLGVATFTSGAVRYRLYSASGLSGAEVASVSMFCAVTTAIGLAVLAGIAFVMGPQQAAVALHIGPGLVLLIGLTLLLAVLGYLLWCALRRAPVELFGYALRPPRLAIALPQILLAAIDLACSAAVLWLLLPASSVVDLGLFIGVYATAITASVISHVPGGLGVFESVIVVALPGVPADQLLGTLLAWRAVYFLLPLLIAALMFAGQEILAQRKRLTHFEQVLAVYVTPVIPQVSGTLVFLAGFLLLVSGATPVIDTRLALIREVLPLAVLEISHLAASVIGLGLMVLARALFRRVAAAYQMTRWLLVAGIVASLLKGLEIEQAIALSIVLFILWLGRRGFYRPSTVMAERFTPAWIASLIIVITAAVWVGFFAHRHVEYSHSLWWTFALEGDAPRMLRASLAVVLLAAAFLAMNLLRPAQPEPQRAGAEDLNRARRVLQSSTQALANAALIGDKRLLFSQDERAFLMYQISGRSWVTLGDPVGDAARHEELLWQLRALADRHAGWSVFYQVSAEKLPLYVDLGLAVLKLGEEARIPLPDFSLEGSRRAELRTQRRRAERDGASFEVVGPAQLAPLLPALQAISDSWLQDKAAAEKGFSVGAFSSNYVSQFPVAIVRCEGNPVAFASLWAAASGEEIAVDLMRFGPDAPRGAMDYLFVELLLWARAQGYQWLNLGMAPLAGLEKHPLAPAWHRVGNFIFRHGEHFFNFDGLRRYKSKFDPVWVSKYLASPGGLVLPRVLLDVSVLISGGVKELFVK